MGAYELAVPKATTGAATVSGTAADVNGTVNPESTGISCTFLYGTSTAYGSSVPCAGPLGSGVGDLPVSGQLTGLQTGTTYHYRVVAATANGTGAGADATFTTPPGGPPTISMVRPADGATYFRQQVVDASYSWSVGAGGAAISACLGTAANGAPIDTAHTGSHTFTVSATSSDGQHVSTTVHYSVALPNNSFTLSHIRASAGGTMSFVVKVPGPGTVDVLESARNDNLATVARALPPGPGRFAFARAHHAIAGKGRITVVVKPSARGKRLVKHPAYPVRLRLQVSYTPTGGLQHNKSFPGIHLSR
jgi:hypothetical protein